LARLRDSWVLALDARNLSPKTIKIYTDAANELLRHLAATDGPDTPEGLTHSHIEGLLAAMRERGLSASTLSITYRSLQQWMTWLAAEEKLPNPMEGTSPPRVPDIPVPVVPDDALTALLRTCEGNDFVSRRDTAIIRMFHDTGGRLTKITRLGVDDVHLGRDANLARVLGKGRRHRDLPFGKKTTQSLDRYLRSRARHPHADLPALWLGRSGALSSSGIYQIIRRRAARWGARSRLGRVSWGDAQVWAAGMMVSYVCALALSDLRAGGWLAGSPRSFVGVEGHRVARVAA